MIIYNPNNTNIKRERLELAKRVLENIPSKYCFITGSFLYKENYKDIDVFVITRSKKKIQSKNNKVKITIIDFNDLHSLFYHSISKSCIAKNILPIKEFKVTISDYWSVINEAVPTVMNQKRNFQKEIRFLILYTEYLKYARIIDTYELNKRASEFKKYEDVLEYILDSAPEIMKKKARITYIKRFFYTQAGFYKDIQYYESQKFLYELAHLIIKEV